ncbi:MAG: guanitoxin biosynthesis heme-dependent pre-guanitoxin N-hydroxylase GntA [Salegentibacter sp.]|uniref:guanitoxin biosynthesis heme-dependent pre-guanitoxin N-hydroxylase GntA n=1 Tax=Salegentibacter sp. TaxID=1903072 RepID=UPI00286FE95A|nr:guanitoxin biosynthesis heme-dependent pre-guanitoxin N-hydroxylase GntA [Salegentibacter sp.]MDR9456364.1 guanitoxin biosynthesis heme-dependent pre-guanitoxin N-hydroxylase GntA [Salegentibacter sp.]
MMNASAHKKFKKSSVKPTYKDFREFIIDKDHPCVMAQTVFSMDKAEIHSYENFGSLKAAKEILKGLRQYLENYDFNSNEFYTFIAAFPEQKNLTEAKFEELLWKQLQLIHQADDKDWDPEVSKDPESKNFSFSIAGKSFYIVGLHPNSSRKARQSPYPALTFNLHWQFEKLREMGSYQNVRDKIRERDIELQGSTNPMLEDFGESSETRQYSGRKVGEEWKCPFLHGKNK